jgi:hypothetical protein
MFLDFYFTLLKKFRFELLKLAKVNDPLDSKIFTNVLAWLLLIHLLIALQKVAAYVTISYPIVNWTMLKSSFFRDHCSAPM